MDKNKKVLGAVSDLAEISYEEYEQAQSICRRFDYQQDKTVQVSVTYKAEIIATVKVPNDWSHKKIKEELKTGHYQFDKDVDDFIRLGKITGLIVNGEEIKI